MVLDEPYFILEVVDNGLGSLAMWACVNLRSRRVFDPKRLIKRGKGARWRKCCSKWSFLDILFKCVKLVKFLMYLISSHVWLGLSTQPTLREVDRVEKVKALGVNDVMSGSRARVVGMEVGGRAVSARMVSRVVRIKVIKNGNKVLTKPVGSSEQTYKPTTAEEKQDRRNEIKARGTLLMALPNTDQQKFHSYQDAKLLMEAIEKRISNTNQNPQNMAFVSSNSSSNTNEADTTVSGVSTAHTQGTTVNATTIDNLSDAIICAFLASQPNTPQLAKEDLEQIDPDDLEEMDLHWEMAILTRRARRFMKRTCRSLDMNGRRIGFDKTKRVWKNNCPSENSTENALIAQDRIGRYDWSYQAEEETPTNYAFMALTSSRSSSSSDSENNRTTKGYHEVPPPLTGNYMPSKRDMRLIDEHFESEYVDVSTVSSSADKTVKTVDITHKGNKCYLTDFKAFDGGFVSFGDGKGIISGKGKIKTGTLDFDDVYFWIIKASLKVKLMRDILLGTKEKLVAGQDEKKKELKKEYILITICTTGPLISQDTKDNAEDAGKKAPKVDAGEASDNGGQDNQVSRSEDGSLFQQDRQTEHNNSTTDINTVSSPVSTARPSFVNAASQIPLNAAGPSASTNAFEEHSFKQFSPFKNSFSLPHVPMVTPIDDTGFFGNTYDDDVLEEEVDMNNVDSSYAIPKATKGQIDKTLFIKRHKDDILLVQVYVDDIIFGSIKKELRLQVKQKSDGIFISQDKYVAKTLKKFDFVTVKTTSTPMEHNKPLIKDEEAKDVDVHLYRSMIGSLMYLTTSRPDITFAVCACARFQVTPKTSHLHAVKRFFRYLKGQPKLGLWYPKDSPFDLESYSDSDYARASLDRKSTTEGCQFLSKRLISWQCKKQTIVANFTTEAEYVAAANCYGQVLWIQN
nr:uncharacterized mitochondrial protein AtMg00810-like [Tanacetum cinerariifolium]